MHPPLFLAWYTRIPTPLLPFLWRTNLVLLYLWRRADIEGVTTCSQCVFFASPDSFHLVQSNRNAVFNWRDLMFHNKTQHIVWAKFRTQNRAQNTTSTWSLLSALIWIVRFTKWFHFNKHLSCNYLFSHSPSQHWYHWVFPAVSCACVQHWSLWPAVSSRS
jgi:hypothetical protein